MHDTASATSCFLVSHSANATLAPTLPLPRPSSTAPAAAQRRLQIRWVAR